MKQIYFNLLKKWCDSLVELQINDVKSPDKHGGIMCPACSMIHGRCGDAVYPLMYMADVTGKKKYLDSAIKLQAWSDNANQPDGSWINDPGLSNWKGITVFGAIALGEALRYHGKILPGDIHKRWKERLYRACNFLYEFINWEMSNINYPITYSATMAIASEIYGEPRFKKKAKEFANEALRYISKENNLIFGEGSPHFDYSPKGCSPVDLGYNVEESLPALVIYGLIMKDKKILDVVEKSIKSHLEFMLPDGAWDNSWGTRIYKWTYWGSRTSDGCQPAFALLANRNPMFAEAALRNLNLYEKCTHKGILYGGPHCYHRGYKPCIHHTFCHAKALATVLDYTNGKIQYGKKRKLCRETAFGIKKYSEIDTLLVAIGKWRGTITAYDWVSNSYRSGHPSGGALSMLWHKDVGPIVTASMTEYRLVETTNMQKHIDNFTMALTPRIELEQDGNYFRNLNDFSAKVQYKQKRDKMEISVTGKLVDKDQFNPKKSPIQYGFSYLFLKNYIEIIIEINSNFNYDKINYIFPVVSLGSEKIKRNGSGCIEILKPEGCLRITTDSPAGFENFTTQRVFNLVPGFEAIPLVIDLMKVKENKLKIKIEVIN
ncbi:MAG: hypothetical protein PHE88_02135 [Elusimicrobia bacterium]|nr:hypothetical protein [Elusimicrobiota bacterium]